MENRATAPFTTVAGCTQRLATLTAFAGRWLLPWVCVLALSVAIAHAAEQALNATLLEDPAARAPLAELGLEGVHQRAPAPVGSHWLTISSVDAQGIRSSITCLTSTDLVSSDAIEVSTEGLDVLESALCSGVSR